jgi:RpiR family transcriptional regulator, carbohydrate utilization regulator
MDNTRTSAARAPVAGCLLRIRSQYRSMAKVHKRIANRILENPQQTIRLPVTELASMADASEASVVLFCKKLGFRGYHDLKITLAEEIFNSSADIHEEIERGDETPTIVKKVFNTSIQALTDSLKVLDVEAVDHAATSMLAARKIYVIGVGISGLIAKDLYMKLFRLGLNANYYDSEWSIRMAGVLAQEGDVIVAISHSGSTTAVVATLEEAHPRGVKTIGLTNYMNSPLTRHVDLLLLTSSRETGVREEEMTSRIAQLATVDSLFVAISNRSYDSSSALLKKTRAAVSNDKV